MCNKIRAPFTTRESEWRGLLLSKSQDRFLCQYDTLKKCNALCNYFLKDILKSRDVLIKLGVYVVKVATYNLSNPLIFN